MNLYRVANGVMSNNYFNIKDVKKALIEITLVLSWLIKLPAFLLKYQRVEVYLKF